jgi:SPP1 family predicted phage head-tail adaptor
MHELILIKKTHNDDDVGNQIPQEVKTTVLCNKKSISRAEFYLAKTTDLKPSLELEVNRYDYNKETEVEFYGKRYKIIRVYGPEDDENIELICEEV